MGNEKRPVKYKGLRDGGEARSRGKSKKDTKRWCKGVIGREHVKAWVPDSRHNHWPKDQWWYSYRCAACEKEFDYCYGSRSQFVKAPERKCKCGNHK